MICECGHNGSIHSSTGGCLAIIDSETGKICPCLNMKIGIEHRLLFRNAWKKNKKLKSIRYAK